MEHITKIERHGQSSVKCVHSSCSAKHYIVFYIGLFLFFSPKRLTIEFYNSGSTKMKRGLLQPGQERPMPALSLKLLLPPTDYYITYEGSATTPACQETATWIVFNRPLYITEQQVCHDIALFSFSFFCCCLNVWLQSALECRLIFTTVIRLEGLETRFSQSQSQPTDQVFIFVAVLVNNGWSHGQQLSAHPADSSSTRPHQYWLHFIRGKMSFSSLNYVDVARNRIILKSVSVESGCQILFCSPFPVFFFVWPSVCTGRSLRVQTDVGCERAN